MTITEPNRRAFKFEFDHMGTLAEAVSTITVSPGKSLLYYFFPIVGGWLSGHQQLRIGDHLQNSLIQEPAKRLAIGKVRELKEIAGIIRHVNLYSSSGYLSTSFGGTLSLTPPIVSVPIGFLTEPGDAVFQGEVPNADRIRAPAAHWKFTEDEVLFFIARELVNIRSNSSVIRVAAKVFFVASIFFIYTAAIPLPLSGILVGASLLLHLISERVLRGRFDIGAVEILSEHFHDQERARNTASSALQKLVDQNLERRELNPIYEWYIDENGNNILDLQHPLLTNRKEKLRERFAPPAAQPVTA